MKEYKHIISLGHACAVAHELERFGYREHSGPFDWQASENLSSKIGFLEGGFAPFFDKIKPEDLYQRIVPSCYMIPEYRIFFVHDFNEWVPVAEQIDSVIIKYQRRVQQFLEDIKEPTLFIYYLFDQNDADWIDCNQNYILNVLHSYNRCNDIVYIADVNIHFKQNCFFVENDPGSDIAYDFTQKSSEITKFLNSIPYSKEKRESNLSFYRRKEKHKKYRSLKRRLIKIWHKLIMRNPYKHFKTSIE